MRVAGEAEKRAQTAEDVLGKHSVDFVSWLSFSKAKMCGSHPVDYHPDVLIRTGAYSFVPIFPYCASF